LKRRGFSIVELLVVVGIIAVLVAILVPTLSRARANALRASCLSNLRQTHTALLLYGNANRDAVPIGYRRTKQFNSMIWSNTANRFVLFGILYQANLLDTPDTFYCPAENNPRFMLGTPENPWPPGPDGDPALPVQAGYGFRPEVDLPDDLANPPASMTNFTMPKLQQFKDRAIVADLANSSVRISTRHERGVNVLFGDGSARFVNAVHFSSVLEHVPEPSFPPNPQWDDEMNRLWTIFDSRP
jgi:prepilin-type N-terminal cleavage/methylation domain-containing protein/prepilin-type processing-associated H-X9-DG protein